MKFVIAFLFVISTSFVDAQTDSVIIDCDIPGGNINVKKMANDTIWLEPDLRDTEGYWFYWNFRIRGMAGRKFVFQFPDKPVFSRMGPAYSINNKDTWKWLGEKSYTDSSFIFEFSSRDSIAYFSMGFPYTSENFEQFKDNFLSKRENVRIDTLAYSRKGRPVEEVYLSPGREAEHRVLISARNHACEMMGSYVLEGIIKSVLEHNSLGYLRDYVEFRIIPFVDKDGVEDGDQGKNRLPRDHNRDYDENSIYPEIQSLMASVPEWSDHKLRINIDLHNPYIRGIDSDAEYIFIVGSEKEAQESQELKFSSILESNNTGELKYYSSNFMKFGDAWNKPSNTTNGQGNSKWGWTIPGIKLSTTIEFPYSYVSGIAVTKDNARIFGEAIALSIQEYLLSIDSNP